MAGAGDQKIEWNLGETITWIRTRDHDRVADLWEASEFEAASRALFDRDLLPKIDPPAAVPAGPGGVAEAAAGIVAHSPTKPSREDGDDVPDAKDEQQALEVLLTEAARRQKRRLPPIEGLVPAAIPQAVMRHVQTRRVRMTMIKDGERVAVAAAEANELELRITDDPLTPVLVWSRTRREPIGTSPGFLRADAIRCWPELTRKTVAVAVAVLEHLRRISTPEAPLMRAHARQRCLEEVPNAYPAAFKRAWKQLEPARKRGVGKHGPRAH